MESTITDDRISETTFRLRRLRKYSPGQRFYTRMQEAVCRMREAVYRQEERVNSEVVLL